MSLAQAAEPEPTTRPALKPQIVVVPVSDDLTFLRGPGLFLRITGKGVGVLEDILPYLDGERTIQEIAEAANLPVDDVAGFLGSLESRRCIEDASHGDSTRLDDDVVAKFSDSLDFYGRYVRDKHEPLENLQSSRILVVGEGEILEETSRFLANEGVGSVGVATYSHPDDAASEPQPLSDELGERLSGAGVDVSIIDRDLRAISDDELEDLLSGWDFALLVQDRPSFTTLRRFNEAALEVEVPWTSAHLDAHAGIVGPTVIPNETACWTCFELRKAGNLSYLDQLTVYNRYAEGVETPDPGRLRPFVSILAGHVAIEALNHASNLKRPQLAGSVYEVDFLGLRSQRHRVLRLPRCPSCTETPLAPVDRLRLDLP